MPQLRETAKAKIDSMSADELRRNIDLEARSPYQGQSYAYLKTRLAQLEAANSEDQRLRENSYRQSEIRIADEANEISRGANRLSKIAVVVSVISLLVALYALGK